MFFLFNICLCLAFSASLSTKISRVIGGTDVDANEFPYFASIRRFSDNAQICGGAIVSTRHVLTTAHCIDPRYVDHQNIIISTGFTRLTITSGFLHLIESVSIHPHYTGIIDPVTMRVNDIALIKLTEFILINDYQRWVELPTQDISNLDSAIIVGWGSNENPPNPLNIPNAVMRSTWMIVINMANCARRLSFPLALDQFCAYQRAGVGVSLGDGGSPLTSVGKLIGLVYSSRPYATGEPEIYVNVFQHLDFISSILVADAQS